jgi:hypothetical protein
LLHEIAPAEAVIVATEEADFAKLGAFTSDPGLPDGVKKAPLSIRSPFDIHVQFRHSLSGASPFRLVTCRNRRDS